MQSRSDHLLCKAQILWINESNFFELCSSDWLSCELRFYLKVSSETNKKNLDQLRLNLTVMYNLHLSV